MHTVVLSSLSSLNHLHRHLAIGKNPEFNCATRLVHSIGRGRNAQVAFYTSGTGKELNPSRRDTFEYRVLTQRLLLPHLALASTEALGELPRMDILHVMFLTGSFQGDSISSTFSHWLKH